MAVVTSFVRLSAALTVTGALTFAGAVTAAAAPPDPAAAITAAGQNQAAASDLLGAYQSAVDGLKQLGIQPFLWPSAAAFCQDGSTLGLVPALAGAVPGPWPNLAVPVPGLDLSAVKAGQTMFAFVPYGLGPTARTPPACRWRGSTWRTGAADSRPWGRCRRSSRR